MNGRTILIGLALALVAGCGGSSSSETQPATKPTEGTSLTRVQSQTLARVLSNNTRQGGARFVLRNPLPDGRTLVMTGQIDFRKSSGSMLLQVEAPTGALTKGRRLAWKAATIYEGDIPGLTAAMAQRKRPGVAWVVRTAALDSGPIDQSIAVLNKLAAPKPENPLLIRQGDNAFLRRDVVDGKTVEVFRVGTTQMTVTTDSATMVGFEARIGTAQGTGSVVLREHGPQRIVLPKASTVVALETIRPLYRELTGQAGGSG